MSCPCFEPAGPSGKPRQILSLLELFSDFGRKTVVRDIIEGFG